MQSTRDFARAMALHMVSEWRASKGLPRTRQWARREALHFIAVSKGRMK